MKKTFTYVGLFFLLIFTFKPVFTSADQKESRAVIEFQNEYLPVKEKESPSKEEDINSIDNDSQAGNQSFYQKDKNDSQTDKNTEKLSENNEVSQSRYPKTNDSANTRWLFLGVSFILLGLIIKKGRTRYEE